VLIFCVVSKVGRCFCWLWQDFGILFLDSKGPFSGIDMDLLASVTLKLVLVKKAVL